MHSRLCLVLPCCIWMPSHLAGACAIPMLFAYIYLHDSMVILGLALLPTPIHEGRCLYSTEVSTLHSLTCDCITTAYCTGRGTCLKGGSITNTTHKVHCLHFRDTQADFGMNSLYPHMQQRNVCQTISKGVKMRRWAMATLSTYQCLDCLT